MTPKVKATKTSKTQFVLQDFPEEFMKSQQRIILQFVQSHGFLLKAIEIPPNTKKR